MRTWITLALLVSAALAGCAGEEGTTPAADPVQNTGDGTNETATSTATATSTEGPGGSGTGGAAANTPPTAELTADGLNGTAPLNVTFNLGGEDADGDALNWTLTINGTQAANGTSLPATVTYNFTDDGNFSVVLAVTDGVNTTQANVTVNVAAPGPTEELLATWTGTVDEPTCIFQDGHGVPDDLWGAEYRVVEGWDDGMYMDFWDAGVNNQVGTSDTQVGTIPEGAGNAWLCMGDSLGFLHDYTIEVWG